MFDFVKAKLLEGNTCEGILAAQIMWVMALSGFSLVPCGLSSF